MSDPKAPTAAGPISPPPVREWRPEWIPAYLSNGLIGLRAGPNPLLEGLAIVNGLAAIDPQELGEGFARGPYPVGGDIAIDGKRMTERPTQARLVEQRYDFSCGELTTRLRYEPDGVGADVEILLFCSRSLPSVVVQQVTVEVDAVCKLAMTARVDPSGVQGRWLGRHTRTPDKDVPVADGFMHWEPYGGISTCGAAYVTTFDGGEGVERTVEEHDILAPLSTTYTVDARPGRRYVLTQFTSLLASQLHHEPDRQAVRAAAMAVQRGFETMRDENRRLWAEVWKGRIRLVGADRRWQELADAAYYYLHASAHASSLFSTSMFGLAYWPNYHYYRGHVMWDVESFAFPVILLTAPDAAESLLEYRFERLAAARHNAAIHGYRGIQFPWASGPRHGEEAIRLSAPNIVFEQHVDLSVAHAFAQFAWATGDQDFLIEKTWPVLEGVAEWVTSRVTATNAGYEIRRVIGVAEQTGPVDNNAYVNMAASVVLRDALAVAEQVGRPPGGHWRDIADGLVIPKNDSSGWIRNHDNYTGRERDTAGATPESPAAFFPFGYRTDPATERATIEFYLGKLDAFIGYPMLSALQGVYAAWIGDRPRSRALFEQGYAEFVQEPYTETNEFSPTRHPDKPRVGPFMANLGGFLTSCLYGLPGIRLGPGEPATWPEREVVMPEGWDAVEVERLMVRGRPMHLVARHGARRATLEAIDGDGAQRRPRTRSAGGRPAAPTLPRAAPARRRGTRTSCRCPRRSAPRRSG
jgi:hypothetical protein